MREVVRETSHLLLGVLLLGVLPLGAPLLAQDAAEHWLYNARERTASGLEAHAEAEIAPAAEAFDAARRLADGHPVTLYNAGTSRLVEAPEQAAELLEEAIEADPTLADAFYNLGNARLASEDTRGAIEAFQQTLRVAPDHRDAKFNLEWALRRMEEEEQSGEDDSQEDQEEEEEEQEEQESEQEEQQQEQQQEQQEQQEPPQDGDPESEPQEGRPENSALPEFRDLPDMTAQEAAEILEAVENLEREERRKQALQSAETSARERKDW